ncbi:MAG: MATE family efflux transporter, partial [Alphaproteobacteria bacterium]|nr:MATE family efflux transporter [Alphaproteobacteria bacterium]
MTDIAEFDPTTAGARVSGHGLDAWIAETKELLKLSGPLILTQLAQMAIGTTDTLMLARFSNTALAGAVLGNTMFYFCWLLGSGPTSAVSPMIAHILGAAPTDRRNVRAVVRMGFWSVLMFSPPLLLLLWFSKPILMSLGQSEELASAASAFIVPLSFGLPFSLGFQVLRNYSTALSKPNAPLIVMGIAVFFNAAFDYAL